MFRTREKYALTGALRTIGRKLRSPKRGNLVMIREKKADSFYSSPEWRSLMKMIIGVRGRRCEDPKHAEGSPRAGMRVYGDHIVEILDGGATLDPANIMLRCGPCHGRKTADARATRART